MTATNNDSDTNVAFKNCALFTKCITHINNEHIHTAENINTGMSMYSLIEYSDTFFRYIWQFMAKIR